MDILAVILCVFAISVGQILFKLAAGRLGGDGAAALVAGFVANPPLLAALAIYGLTTLAWVWLLRERTLSGVYPVFALSFVFVPLLGRIFLAEPLNPALLAGTALVVAGLFVITAFQ